MCTSKRHIQQKEENRINIEKVSETWLLLNAKNPLMFKKCICYRYSYQVSWNSFIISTVCLVNSLSGFQNHHRFFSFSHPLSVSLLSSTLAPLFLSHFSFYIPISLSVSFTHIHTHTFSLSPSLSRVFFFSLPPLVLLFSAFFLPSLFLPSTFSNKIRIACEIKMSAFLCVMWWARPPSPSSLHRQTKCMCELYEAYSWTVEI